MKTIIRTFTLGIALYTVPACFDSDDSRRALVELRCDDTCEARWAGTDEWSSVHSIEDIIGLPEVDPGGLWACAPDPDVDVCVFVDDHGRVGCFRDEGDWAVAVAPSCAVDGLNVGIGMVSRAR